jgi:hypothetical protein
MNWMAARASRKPVGAFSEGGCYLLAQGPWNRCDYRAVVNKCVSRSVCMAGEFALLPLP